MHDADRLGCRRLHRQREERARARHLPGSVDTVVRLRLANLLLTAPAPTAVDVVRHLVAVQAQDFAGARWAIGMRLARLPTDTAIAALFDAGKLLRVHVLRPTWHAVLPEDLRWLQALTAARVNRAMASRDRELDLDGKTYAKSQKLIARALEGGQHLTRAELRAALTRGGIATPDQRLGHILMRAELDQVVCSGARRGKQTTHALLDEVVPAHTARRLGREAAAAELARRFFASHGPAQLVDFAWWSGLTLGDARAAVAELGDDLERRVLDGKSLYGGASGAGSRKKAVHLLPNFDELTVAYRDRTFTYDKARLAHVGVRPDVLSNHLVAHGGEIIGAWRRTVDKRGLVVSARLVRAAPLDAAADRLGGFLELPARLDTTLV